MNIDGAVQNSEAVVSQDFGGYYISVSVNSNSSLLYSREKFVQPQASNCNGYTSRKLFKPNVCANLTEVLICQTI